jgi:hypothetical protein
MKTLYLSGFLMAALEAMGKKTSSLSDEIDGDDLRAVAQMLDIALMRKREIEVEKSNKA